MQTQSSLLPLGAMARRAHVPTRWLRDEAVAGRVPHLNAGGRLLFNPALVHAGLVARPSGNHAELDKNEMAMAGQEEIARGR